MSNQPIQLRKAERKRSRLRIGITAPSGAGKTYSSLLLAKGMTGDWSKICVIDTENGSGELYSHLGEYNVITLTAPFSPERYIEALNAAEQAGMEVIVIDSISHEWDGQGGILEIIDDLGGKYQDWGKVTPRHRRMLQAILQSPAHIITTTRRKQDYDMVKGGDGKLKVEKVGLKEIQREGFEYELTINFELDQRHNAVASKDRTGLFADKPEFKIDQHTGETLIEWNKSGKIDYTQLKKQIFLSLKHLEREPKTAEEAQTIVKELTSLELIEENYEEISSRLRVFAEEAQVKQATKGTPQPKKVETANEELPTIDITDEEEVPETTPEEPKTAPQSEEAPKEEPVAEDKPKAPEADIKDEDNPFKNKK